MNNEDMVSRVEFVEKQLELCWERCKPGKAPVLDRMDFTNLELDGLDFSGVTFTNCTFINTKLTNVNMSYTHLEGTSFNKAFIRNVNFRSANLTNADFSGAHILFSDMSGTIINGVNFVGANISNIGYPFADAIIDNSPKVDIAFAKDFAKYFCALDCDDPRFQNVRNTVLDFIYDYYSERMCNMKIIADKNKFISQFRCPNGDCSVHSFVMTNDEMLERVINNRDGYNNTSCKSMTLQYTVDGTPMVAMEYDTVISHEYLSYKPKCPKCESASLFECQRLSSDFE